jgi:hypothetical protein
MKLDESLLAFNGELKAIRKDGRNPHFNSVYVTLDAILDTVRPLLTKHGLYITQDAEELKITEEGRITAVKVTTSIRNKEGETRTSAVWIPLNRIDPHGMGGAVTYGRRYSLSMLLAISADEDEDGNVPGTKPAGAGIKLPPVKTLKPLGE